MKNLDGADDAAAAAERALLARGTEVRCEGRRGGAPPPSSACQDAELAWPPRGESHAAYLFCSENLTLAILTALSASGRGEGIGLVPFVRLPLPPKRRFHSSLMDVRSVVAHGSRFFSLDPLHVLDLAIAGRHMSPALLVCLRKGTKK